MIICMYMSPCSQDEAHDRGATGGGMSECLTAIPVSTHPEPSSHALHDAAKHNHIVTEDQHGRREPLTRRHPRRAHKDQSQISRRTRDLAITWSSFARARAE